MFTLFLRVHLVCRIQRRADLRVGVVGVTVYFTCQLVNFSCQPVNVMVGEPAVRDVFGIIYAVCLFHLALRQKLW